MNSMMLDIWGWFCSKVSSLSNTTFSLIVTILGVCALLGFLSFFKKNFDKGKAIKWTQLVITILLFAVVAVLCLARFV